MHSKTRIVGSSIALAMCDSFYDEPLINPKDLEHKYPFGKRDGHIDYMNKRSKGDRKRNPRWRRR